MNNPQLTTVWSSVMVEELIRQGASFFCISPGSRSTPLTAAIARNPEASWKMFPDERSAGFFALGHARATGFPAVLVCTSGTAVANYLPAVVEASNDRIPMLILSADRPFELRECGANQTIRQNGIFGTFTRWQMELPEPSTSIPLQSLLSTIAHGVEKSLNSPRGPVHLNQPFREPFEPESCSTPEPWLEPLQAWQTGRRPSTVAAQPEKHPDMDSMRTLRELTGNARQPLIIAGNSTDENDSRAIAELADDLQVPLYADMTSGLRFSSSILPWQQAFASPEFRNAFRPDLVIHFGGGLISRHPSDALKQWKPDHLAVIRNHPGRYSPDHSVTLSIEASLRLTADALRGCRTGISALMAPAKRFFTEADREIAAATAPDLPVSEIGTARIVSELLPPDHLLFLSNSMPVRAMDTYAHTGKENPIKTGTNRGASGIDGIISTAAGFAEGHGQPLCLMIGDLAFLHDLNALSLINSLRVPIQLILLNNNGGGIFSFLPVSEFDDIFEPNFATPQNFSGRPAAAMFGLDYAAPLTNSEFRESLLSALNSNRSTIIEVVCSRSENVRLHRALQARLGLLATEAFFIP